MHSATTDPPAAPPCRARPPGARRGEHGVSIVLAMLVLFVLVVVVFEIRYSAAVEQDQARMIVDARRMGLLADAGRLQAESALIMDLEAAQAGEEAGGPTGGPDDEPPDDEAPDDEAEGPMSGEPSVADTTAATDSRLDEWNDPLALAPSFGEEYQVLVEVEDEDGKINLLGQWTADAVQRDAQREIATTLLDKAFEGTSLDLSFADSLAILQRLDEWARGNRGSFDPIPVPTLKKSNAEEQAEEGSLDQEVLLVDEKHRPLTLGELGLIEGLRPEHVSGFVEDDVFHPGLDRYLTLWTQLELKPPPPEADPFANSPFTKFTQGSLFDQTMGEEESGPEEPIDVTPEPMNDGLVNVNTAPLVVLRALSPPDIPTSFLEKVDEFRRKIDELKQEGALDAGDSLFGKDTFGGSSSDESGEDEEEALDDDEDVTTYVFKALDEVVGKIEQEYNVTLALDPGVEITFLSRLSVTSHVFTIKVLVYTLDENELDGRKQFGKRASFRCVVWRMVLSEGVSVLTLLPLEPYHDPRRLVDYGLDLDEFGEDHIDRMREREQQLGVGF